jgi:hypothetical protein
MISQSRFFGGAKYATSATSFALDWGAGRVHTINMSAGGQTVSLPDSRIAPLRPGGPTWIILNVGANSFNVVDFVGGVVITLASDKAGVICMRAQPDATGRWSAGLRDIL